MWLFPSIFVPLPFFVCMESMSYVFSFLFRKVFFHLVTTGWIFDISLCENLIKSINIFIDVSMFEEPRLYFTAFLWRIVSAVITEYNSLKTFLVSSLPETWLSGVYMLGESFRPV